MCDLASAMAVVNGLGTILSIGEKNRYALELARNAQKAAVLDFNAIEEQQTQINKAAQLEQAERVRQAIRERSRLKAAMGDANVTGLTPLREIASSYIQQEYDVGVMKTDQENRLSEAQRAKYQVEANRQSRILQARSQLTNPFLGLLQIGGSAMSGYATGYRMDQYLRAWE